MVSEIHLQPREPCTRGGRAVDVAGVTVGTLVEGLLIGVEDILYSGIQLQFYPVGQL